MSHRLPENNELENEPYPLCGLGEEEAYIYLFNMTNLNSPGQRNRAPFIVPASLTTQDLDK